MKRFFKFALVAAIGILVLGAAGFGFLYWSMQHDFVEQTTGPLTREKALKHCPISLPSTARNIQYASFNSGLQAAEMFVRFEAPVPDCYACAQTLFARRAKDDSRYSIPVFRTTAHPESIESTNHLQTSWFDTDRTSKWVVAGRGSSWEPKVWIDTEAGIFYYYVTD